jgi:hypothetical protein
MRSRTIFCKKTIIDELAEAISSLNIHEISRLMSENGKFVVQNENHEVMISDKEKFIKWLSVCYHDYMPAWRLRKRLKFNIVKSMHYPTGNPVIIFEDGRFPAFTFNQTQIEKSGFVIISENNRIMGIEFCLLKVKTESPFIYEKISLKPALT